MSLTIDYYAGLSSPWTYLGHERLCSYAEQAGATVNFIPVDFNAVFDKTGGLPLPKRSPERRQYRYQELKRWSKKLNIPLNLDPKFFPVPHTKPAMICLLLQNEGGNPLPLAGAYMKAVWADEKDITDNETIISIANDQGLDGRRLFEQSLHPDISKQYEENTSGAVKRGVFGAPSYVIGEEIFWGQDRLMFVEQKLKEAKST